jgi:hypothetical protein
MAVPLSGATPSMVTARPDSEIFPESRRLSARNAAVTAASQFFGAPEATSSLSSSPGRSNNCRDNSRTFCRAPSLGTLPDRLSSLASRSATNTNGSAIGGLTFSAMMVSPVGNGPLIAFFTSA